MFQQNEYLDLIADVLYGKMSRDVYSLAHVNYLKKKIVFLIYKSIF